MSGPFSSRPVWYLTSRTGTRVYPFAAWEQRQNVAASLSGGPWSSGREITCAAISTRCSEAW